MEEVGEGEVATLFTKRDKGLVPKQDRRQPFSTLTCEWLRQHLLAPLVLCTYLGKSLCQSSFQ